MLVVDRSDSLPPSSMSLYVTDIRKSICAGTIKVLYSVDLKWSQIKDQPIGYTFTSVANPTSWKTFMQEAVGTAIQQELILRGAYCPNLESTFVTYATEDPMTKTWGDLETLIDLNARNCQSTF